MNRFIKLLLVQIYFIIATVTDESQKIKCFGIKNLDLNENCKKPEFYCFLTPIKNSVRSSITDVHLDSKNSKGNYKYIGSTSCDLFGCYKLTFECSLDDIPLIQNDFELSFRFDGSVKHSQIDFDCKENEELKELLPTLVKNEELRIPEDVFKKFKLVFLYWIGITSTDLTYMNLTYDIDPESPNQTYVFGLDFSEKFIPVKIFVVTENEMMEFLWDGKLLRVPKKKSGNVKKEEEIKRIQMIKDEEKRLEEEKWVKKERKLDVEKQELEQQKNEFGREKNEFGREKNEFGREKKLFIEQEQKLEEQKKRFEAYKTQFVEETKLFEKKITGLNEEINGFKKILNGLEKEKNAEKQRRLKIEEEMHKIKQEKKRLENKIDELETEKNVFVKEKLNSEKNKYDFQEEIDSLKFIINQLKIKNKLLENGKFKKDEEMRKFEKNMNEYDKKLKKMEEENKRILEEKERLENQKKGLDESETQELSFYMQKSYWLFFLVFILIFVVIVGLVVKYKK